MEVCLMFLQKQINGVGLFRTCLDKDHVELSNVHFFFLLMQEKHVRVRCRHGRQIDFKRPLRKMINVTVYVNVAYLNN